MLLDAVRILLVSACATLAIPAWCKDQSPDGRDGNEESAIRWHAITGTNSHLKAGQYVRINNADAWKRAWFAHHGTLDPSSDCPSVPDVDFGESMVIAVVEKAGSRKDLGLLISRTTFNKTRGKVNYAIVAGRKQQKSPMPRNVFAFFVLPRFDRELILQRDEQDKLSRRNRDAITKVAVIAPADVDAARLQGSRSVLSSDFDPDACVENIVDPPRGNKTLNITFAVDPGPGNRNAVGDAGDLWNLAALGETAVDFMRYSDATCSPVKMRISPHDGVWGIEGQEGVFHSYIYHNCQCVDLEVTLLGLPRGRYCAHVYAHGDAPNQNAAIELRVGNAAIATKATINDGTWRFRESPLVEGVHYVTFELQVNEGDDVRFISHRDGSGYSMFNAIQIVPIQ